jgi:hypothetical protein
MYFLWLKTTGTWSVEIKVNAVVFLTIVEYSCIFFQNGIISYKFNNIFRLRLNRSECFFAFHFLCITEFITFFDSFLYKTLNNYMQLKSIFVWRIHYKFHRHNRWRSPIIKRMPDYVFSFQELFRKASVW